jgi:hypothetical protein
VWETTDPDGRRVVLSFERWRHVLEDHAELSRHREAVLEAVARPDVRLDGRLRGEEWFYRRTAAPSRWVKVVVHYEGGSGRIVTAFPRRKLP